jgi:ferredoxin
VITKVWIEPGCIVCRACEVQCAEVFDVRDDGARVRKVKLTNLDARIRQAAADCPVKVIEFREGKPGR